MLCCVSPLFPLWLSDTPPYGRTTFVIRPSIEGHLGCFHLLITESAALNTCARECLPVSSSLGASELQFASESLEGGTCTFCRVHRPVQDKPFLHLLGMCSLIHICLSLTTSLVLLGRILLCFQ